MYESITEYYLEGLNRIFNRLSGNIQVAFSSDSGSRVIVIEHTIKCRLVRRDRPCRRYRT